MRSLFSELRLNASQESLEDPPPPQRHATANNKQQPPTKRLQLECPSTNCCMKLRDEGELQQHWLERHHPQIIFYYCPLPGCSERRNALYKLRGHLYNEGHFCVGQKKWSRNDVKNFLAKLPFLAQLCENKNYRSPQLPDNVKTPVESPTKLSAGLVPIESKENMKDKISEAFRSVMRRPFRSERRSNTYANRTTKLQANKPTKLTSPRKRSSSTPTDAQEIVSVAGTSTPKRMKITLTYPETTASPLKHISIQNGDRSEMCEFLTRTDIPSDKQELIEACSLGKSVAEACRARQRMLEDGLRQCQESSINTLTAENMRLREENAELQKAKTLNEADKALWETEQKLLRAELTKAREKLHVAEASAPNAEEETKKATAILEGILENSRSEDGTPPASPSRSFGIRQPACLSPSSSSSSSSEEEDEDVLAVLQKVSVDRPILLYPTVSLNDVYVLKSSQVKKLQLQNPAKNYQELK